MKRIFFSLLAMLSIFIWSCKKNHLEGVYVCDASGKKADTTIHHKDYDEAKFDFTCIISELEFVGESIVKFKTEGGNMAYKYSIDGDNVLINTGEANLLLKLNEQHSLVGEGILAGTFSKK
jgi:uncharacterized protein YpmS